MGWSDDQVERLVHMWTVEGLSGSQIAERFGVTRNVVAGKINRLGLGDKDKPESYLKGAEQKRATRAGPKRTAPIKPPTVQPEGPTQRPKHEPATCPVVPEPKREPGFEPCTLLELGSDNCRWPIGDPKTPEFHFCGRRAKLGKPYCAEHCGDAVQPLPGRGRRASAGEKR